MQENDHIELLENIKKVDAPPFLFTRIEAKIAHVTSDKLNWKWALSGLATLALVLTINITLSQNVVDEEPNNNIVSELNLSPTNQLYHD